MVMLTLCTSSHVQRADVTLLTWGTRQTPFLLVANSTDIAGVALESISSILPCAHPSFYPVTS